MQIVFDFRINLFLIIALIRILIWVVSCLWTQDKSSLTITSISQGRELLFIFGFRTENVLREEEEGGTLTAWGLVVLVVWEEIVQSLFTGVGVLLLLRGE